MTQQERAGQNDGDHEVQIYETQHIPPPVKTYEVADQPAQPAAVRSAPMQPVVEHVPTHVNVDTTVFTPTDRVRWGAIIAGLLTALSTLAVLSVLGLALGASTFDPGDNARSYGIGAGIWGGLTALISFFVGGFMAARTAAVRGDRNGLLNGALVWAVAIPLLLYLLSGGVGSLLRTAGNVATTGAQVAGQAAGDQALDPQTQATVQENLADVQATAEAVVTPQRVENVADGASKGAWGTLGSLLLGLSAAGFGGLAGARQSLSGSGFPGLRRRNAGGYLG